MIPKKGTVLQIETSLKLEGSTAIWEHRVHGIDASLSRSTAGVIGRFAECLLQDGEHALLAFSTLFPRAVQEHGRY